MISNSDSDIHYFIICRIIERNNEKAPLTYKQFQRVIDGMDPPPKPVPTLTLQMLGSAVTPVAEDHDDKFGVPTLEELGFDCEYLKPPVWLGGESEALSRQVKFHIISYFKYTTATRPLKYEVFSKC